MIASHHIEAVGKALSNVTGTEELVPHVRWNLVLRDSSPVAARLLGRWLVMTSPVAECFPPLDFLGWNATLPGLAKFAFDNHGATQIRAELPVDDDASTEALIQGALGGFEAARAILRGEAPQNGTSDALLAISPDDLERLLAEAAWSFSKRDDGSFAVELECPGVFFQAAVTAGLGGMRASVELGNCPQPSNESALALPVFLLSAGSALRMARPFAIMADGNIVSGFEVALPSPPTGAQIAHALSALSVACRHCAAELKALENQDVAREYLALRMRPGGRDRSFNKHTNINTI